MHCADRGRFSPVSRTLGRIQHAPNMGSNIHPYIRQARRRDWHDSSVCRMWCLAGLLTVLTVVSLVDPTLAARKRKSAPRLPPDLKITSVMVSPEEYSPGFGTLDLRIEIELPKNLDGSTLLEVSTLITSPSKRSLRFLSVRQPIPDSPTPQAGTSPVPRLSVTLSWDGTDQAQRLVSEGRYTYEVRAKLLAMSDNGPRTHMVSWPKRGTVELK